MTEILDVTITQVRPGDLLGQEGRVRAVSYSSSYVTPKNPTGMHIEVGPCWARPIEMTVSGKPVTLLEPAWGTMHIATPWRGTRRVIRDAPLPPIPTR